MWTCSSAWCAKANLFAMQLRDIVSLDTAGAILAGEESALQWRLVTVRSLGSTSRKVQGFQWGKLPVRQESLMNQFAKQQKRSSDWHPTISTRLNIKRNKTKKRTSKDVTGCYVGQHDKWQQVVFTGRTLLTVGQAHNRQNDGNWPVNSPGTSDVVTNRQDPMSVIVSALICTTGKTLLVFLESGVKINKDVHRWDVLGAVVLP